MKKLVIAVSLIAASLLVAPKFIGGIVETEREHSVMELNKTDGVILTTNNYVPSWFGATVTSELTLSLEEAGLTDINVLVEERLSFGPVMITERGLQFGLGFSEITLTLLSPDVDEEVTALLSDKLHISALLGFNKAITTFIEADEITYEEPGASIVSASFKANFSLQDNTYISGNLSWGGLEFSEDGESLTIGKVTMSTNQEVVSGNYLQGTAILVGDIALTTEKIEILEQGAAVFSLNNAELKSDVSLTDGLLTLTMAYQAKDIMASGQGFTEPTLLMTLENLDHKALQALNTATAELSSNIEQVDSEAALAMLSEAFDKILAKEPILKIEDLSVISEQGKIATEFNFTLNKDLFDPKNLNSMALIMALEADAKGFVPVEFLAKFGVEPMVNNFVEQGYFTQQDNNIHVEAQYRQSQLILNGKPFQM